MSITLETTSYLSDLQRDLRNVGLNPFPISITDMSSLVTLVLDHTSEIGSDRTERGRLEEVDQTTTLGQQVLKWHNLARANKLPIFSDSGTFTTCQAAEPGFINGLEKSCMRPSLIITDCGEPIGISKPFGVKTTLGLKDMPNMGLLENVISSNPLLGVDYMRGLPTAPACSIDIRSIPEVFTPRRVSIFAIPHEVRTELTDNQAHWDLAPQAYSLDRIIEKCEELLRHPDTIHLNDRFRDFQAS